MGSTPHHIDHTGVLLPRWDSEHGEERVWMEQVSFNEHPQAPDPDLQL